MSKLLTISIAAYNVSSFLEKTLGSLLPIGTPAENPDIYKRYTELLEVLIIDDGSGDKTAAITDDFIRENEMLLPNVFRLISKKNGGYGSTINRGVSEARGLFFRQLDGDDWLESGNLPAFLDFLEGCEADLVLSPFTEYYEDGKIIPVLRHMSVPEKSISLMNADLSEPIMMHELTLRTKLLQGEDCLLTEHCFYTDEEYVYLPLLQATTITRFPLPLYGYRLGLAGQSVSPEGFRKHQPDTEKVAGRLYEKYHRLVSDSSNAEMPDGTLVQLQLKLKRITSNVFRGFFLMADSKEGCRSAKKFDRNLKLTYPEIYAITSQVKRIRLLRISHYLLWGMLRKKLYGSIL